MTSIITRNDKENKSKDGFWAKYTSAPIIAVDLYKNDLFIKKAGCGGGNGGARGGSKPITYFSRRSRANLRHYAQNTAVKFYTMLTVTYPREYPSDGKLVKRHLKRLLQYLKRRYGNLSYIWWLEFQLRGAPHLHFVLSHKLKIDRRVSFRRGGAWHYFETSEAEQEWISRTWYHIVNSGDERHLRAGCRFEKLRLKDGAARYISKESTKMYQKVVPTAYSNVGRLWGASRDVRPKLLETVEVDEQRLREILAAGGEKITEFKYRCLFGMASAFNKGLSLLLVENKPIAPEAPWRPKHTKNTYAKWLKDYPRDRNSGNWRRCLKLLTQRAAIRPEFPL